jgi:hypothetical protein
MVKPKEYQVGAVHKVAPAWYSGYSLVWPKLDGSRDITPWQPCKPRQLGIPYRLHLTDFYFIFIVIKEIASTKFSMHVLLREKRWAVLALFFYY